MIEKYQVETVGQVEINSHVFHLFHFSDYVAQKFGITQKEVRNLMTTKINNIIKCCKQQKIVEQKND